jgi:hypothetical protein
VFGGVPKRGIKARDVWFSGRLNSTIASEFFDLVPEALLAASAAAAVGQPSGLVCDHRPGHLGDIRRSLGEPA